MPKKYFSILILAAALGLAAIALWFLSGRPLLVSRIQKVYKVGVVSFGGAHVETITGLKEGMGSLGYQEGVNIIYEIADAAGSDEKAKLAAERFLREKVDAVYSASTPVTKQVSGVIKNIPIVFNIVSDPVGAGFAKSLESSGTNLTGCSNYVGQTGPKRLEIAREILPQAKTVLVLYDPKNKFSQDAILILREAAQTLGFSLAEKEIGSKEEAVRLMNGLRPGEYDVFFHLGEAKVSAAADAVIEAANKIKLPTIAHEETFARKGMLAVYGPSWKLLGRQCAETLNKVLGGTPPSQIPIQIPEKMELLVNLKTAKIIGATLPDSFLRKVDVIINE